jgi:hypothetical protein
MTIPMARVCVAIFCAAGCGGNAQSPLGTNVAPRSATPAPQDAAVAPAAVVLQEPVPGGNAAGGKQEGPADAGKLHRQIIYDAEVRLFVEDFEGLPEKVDRLIAEAGGFVAQAKLHGKSGSPRRGEWKIRLPLDGYTSFLEAARKLGEMQSLAANSQDVSEQYYDLEARIRNKQKEEARLLKHLDENTGKLEEILTVEREISRVREELERMEGRIRVLKDLVSLATVTLHVDEIKGYTPPQAPTFGLRVSRAFEGSWKALVATGEGLVVACVVIGPWLGAIAVPGLTALTFIRRRKRLM